MLIEFSVRNFRSFRERQTLSMVAAPRLGKKQNVFKPKVAGEKLPNLLKVAAIYGPNASGKSGLVSAISIVSRMLAAQYSEDDVLPVDAFRLDANLRDKPSDFEYNFVTSGVRYQYILSLTPERIIEETLVSYPKGRETPLYSRHYIAGTGEKYSFGEGLEGGGIVHEAWKKLTGPKSLFLNQAVINSSENLTQLKAPYEWFRRRALCIGQDRMGDWSVISRSMIRVNSVFTKDLQEFLQDIDVPITGIRFEVKNKTAKKIGPESNFLDHVEAVDRDARTVLTHTTALGEADFDYDEESGGTKNLMGFWLPWTAISESKSEHVLGSVRKPKKYDFL